MTANADVAQPGDRQQADDEYTILFAEVLRRHNQGHSETDVRSAVRDFILGAELARPAEINQEESPTDGAAGRVDMVVRETFIEFKRENLYSRSFGDPSVHQATGTATWRWMYDQSRGIKTVHSDRRQTLDGAFHWLRAALNC